MVQEQAVRLFLAQGYEQTSIEQIAEAAEVSPSTVFRYFPTKPDLVLYDAFDARMFSGFRQQPPDLTCVQALRATLSRQFPQGGREWQMQRDRERLIRSVPELRATILDSFTQTLSDVARLVAERTGRSADDDEVLALVGSVMGVAISAWLSADQKGWDARSFMQRIDAGLALLENAFRF